jgi:hypothetical protein
MLFGLLEELVQEIICRHARARGALEHLGGVPAYHNLDTAAATEGDGTDARDLFKPGHTTLLDGCRTPVK